MKISKFKDNKIKLEEGIIMKTKKVLRLVIFFSILIIINLLVFAVDSEKQASDFQSNGDLIEGWNWLRDSALKHYAEWTFEEITPGSEDLVLDITALATDRPNGGSGFKAKFKLIYGFPGSGSMGGVFKTKVVTLPNVSPPGDPLGYHCQGQVTVDREFISGASTIVFRVERESVQDNHVAFKKESIVLLITEEAGEGQFLEGNQLPETDELEEATLIQPGTYTGCLGEEPVGGQIDDNDYYSINLEEGQQITLQLTVPGNASYGISLLNPNHYSKGSSITQREIKTLDYVADSTGTWYIKISRSSGEGEYQLSVNTSFGGAGEPGNHSPVISSVNAAQESIEINNYVNITCSASDQDGDSLTFNWTVNGQVIEGNNSFLNWRAPNISGNYTITCTVSDSRGGEDNESVSITVTELSNGDNDNIGEVNYRIEITTGSRIAAGTDANVYITMYDKDGHNSGEILLDNPGVNDFEIGDNNTFSVTAINIENLDYIIIRHDNSGNFPGWYVDEIQVSNKEINKEWTFLPDQWLATDEPPDYQTQGKFYPQEETVEENIEYILSLTDGGGTLTSNLPIFVKEDKVGNLEIDSDGDGILQEWEDKAIEYINPYIELDEEEPWLQHQDSDYVANYIRVHPYDPFSTSTTFNSANLPKYIIFRYVVTWSQDYGRQSYGGVNFDIWTSHPGDHERIFMAWKVIDSNTLKLDWVFTSSHEDPDAHHAVWNASYRTCNKGDVATWPPKEYDHSEVFCGELQFNEDGRLVIYASEGKHALYPSCDICDNKVMLVDLPGPVNVGEDCGGGGRFRFDCYNVGEPPNLIDPKVHDLDLKLDTFKNDLPDILINKLKSHYRISINTSDRDLAGTDAEIQIKLFGENNMNSQWFTVYSKSDPPRLASHVGTFERGDKDNIIVECSDLGKIIKIQIKHDNSGLGPGWHINEIWVENLKN